mmetsp:Transcript_61330/g.101328  ORF Transcript_61330/g.101328 Transcript_61330/m.101328 type:complete len:282 (-) Transcript_61330:1305-2150(-)
MDPQEAREGGRALPGDLRHARGRPHRQGPERRHDRPDARDLQDLRGPDPGGRAPRRDLLAPGGVRDHGLQEGVVQGAAGRAAGQAPRRLRAPAAAEDGGAQPGDHLVVVAVPGPGPRGVGAAADVHRGGPGQGHRGHDGGGDLRAGGRGQPSDPIEAGRAQGQASGVPCVGARHPAVPPRPLGHPGGTGAGRAEHARAVPRRQLPHRRRLRRLRGVRYRGGGEDRDFPRHKGQGVECEASDEDVSTPSLRDPKGVLPFWGLWLQETVQWSGLTKPLGSAKF